MAPKAKELDWEKVEKLYMDGLTDSKISKEMGCSADLVAKWREKNDLPNNIGLFAWQNGLKKYEFRKIPQKYWNPRFRGMEV